MKKYRVRRTTYKSLSQDKLLVFAQKVVDSTFEKETYQEMADQVLELKDNTNAYDLALVAAKDGGKAATVAKNLAKTAVDSSLDNVADALDYFGSTDLTFYVNAGMAVQNHTRTRSFEKQIPNIPNNPIAKPTTVRGCIQAIVEVPNAEHVLNVAAEWSEDNGQTWHNGNYFTPSKSKTTSIAKGKMKNLPSFKEVSVRFRCIGKHDTKSEWTVPIVVPVL